MVYDCREFKKAIAKDTYLLTLGFALLVLGFGFLGLRLRRSTSLMKKRPIP